MDKKKMLVGLVATSAIVGANSVKADEAVKTEPVTPNTTQTEATKTVAATEEAVKQAEVKLTESQKASEVAEAKAKDAEAKVTESGKESKEASTAVKNAEELVAKATPEEKKKVEDDIQEKEKLVTKAENVLSESKKIDEKADKANQTQNKKVSEAKKDVLNKATEVREAEDAVKKAEDAFDSATLVKAQKEAKELEVKKTTAEEKVKNLTSEVGEANKELTALKASGSEKRLTLEKELKNAGPEFLTEIVTHELERKDTPDYESKTPALASDKMVARDGKTYYIAANENVDFNGEKTEIVEVKSEEYFKKPHVIDYKKVSEEVRNYLIELRKINGIDIPVPEVTDKALKYAKARADEMIEKDELSHATKLKKEDFGLRGSTENASAGTLPYEDTVSEKELAYNLILRYFNDYSNASSYGSETPSEANRMNYGHRIPLLAASGTGIAVGSSFDEKSQFGNYGTLQFVTDDPNHPVYPTVEGSYTSTWHLAKAENKDSDMSHSEFYFNGKRVKFLPKTTFVYVWKETTHPKNPAFEKAQEALNEFKTKQEESEKKLTSALDGLNKQLDDAKTVLNAETTALTKANEKVAELTKSDEEKVGVLKAAQEELTKREAKMKDAEAELAKQNSELDRLTEIKKATTENVKKSEKVLLDAKADLDSAKKHLQELANAPKLLEEAKKRSEKANDDLEKTKVELNLAIKALKEAKEKEEAAKKHYEDVYNAYKTYLKAKEDAEREAKIKKEYEEAKKSGSTPVAIVDAKGNIVGYKAVPNIPTAPAKQAPTSQVSRSGKASSNQLPHTGDSSSVSLASSIVLFALGLLGLASKKKEN